MLWESDGKTPRGIVPNVADFKTELASQPEISYDHAGLLAMMKEESRLLVVSMAQEYGSRLTANYPLHEILSWTTKVAEAKSIIAGATDPKQFPIITAECSFTGMPVRETADYILAKSAPYLTASGFISGIRQETIRRIDLAASKEDIEAALQWAKSTADEALASLK